MFMCGLQKVHKNFNQILVITLLISPKIINCYVLFLYPIFNLHSCKYNSNTPLQYFNVFYFSRNVYEYNWNKINFLKKLDVCIVPLVTFL